MPSWTTRAKELLATLGRQRATSELIETELSAIALQDMFQHVERCWTALGEQEPHWSVLTQPEYRAARIVDSRVKFYQSGKHDANMLLDAAARCGVRLPTRGACFELGCGVGRVSIWLASIFDRLLAADISTPHLREAEQEFRSRNLLNASTIAITGMNMLGALPPFDCFYSVIVLQHNPPPVIRWMLETILGQLRSGGIGFFQLPVHLPNYSFVANTYLNTLETRQEMEVHALPRSALMKVLQRANCSLLEEVPHDCLGIPGALSNNFLVRRN